MLGGVRNLSSLFEGCKCVLSANVYDELILFGRSLPIRVQTHSDAHWEIREALFAKIEKGVVSGMRGNERAKGERKRSAAIG